MIMKIIVVMAVAVAQMTRRHGPQEKPRALQLPHNSQLSDRLYGERRRACRRHFKSFLSLFPRDATP
jgi:hypothetical protein